MATLTVMVAVGLQSELGMAANPFPFIFILFDCKVTEVTQFKRGLGWVGTVQDYNGLFDFAVDERWMMDDG